MSASSTTISDVFAENPYDFHYGFNKPSVGKNKNKLIKEYIKDHQIDVAFAKCSNENKQVIAKGLLDFIVSQNASIVEHHDQGTTTRFTNIHLESDHELRSKIHDRLHKFLKNQVYNQKIRNKKNAQDLIYLSNLPKEINTAKFVSTLQFGPSKKSKKSLPSEVTQNIVEENPGSRELCDEEIGTRVEYTIPFENTIYVDTETVEMPPSLPHHVNDATYIDTETFEMPPSLPNHVNEALTVEPNQRSVDLSDEETGTRVGSPTSVELRVAVNSKTVALNVDNALPDDTGNTFPRLSTIKLPPILISMMNGTYQPTVMLPPKPYQYSIMSNILNDPNSSYEYFLPIKRERWYTYAPVTVPSDSIVLTKEDVGKMNESNVITETMMNVVIHVYNR